MFKQAYGAYTLYFIFLYTYVLNVTHIHLQG